MGSLVLTGDTSGSVTVAVPAVAGTNTATFPASTGTVMVSGNMPAFSAYSSNTSSAITSATDTKILFDTESFDTNNNFASSRFTPTVAGYYQINATLRANGTFTTAALILFKNGSNAGYLQNGASNIITCSSLQYMNGTTDYLEIYTNLTGTALTTGAPNANTNYFSAALVRAA